MHLFGIHIDELCLDDVLNRVRQFVHSDRQHQIVSINPEGIVLAQNHERYREVLSRASLSLADGFGVVWAARLLHSRNADRRGVLQYAPTPAKRMKRVPGADLILALSEEAAWNGWRVYLVGGMGDTAMAATGKLKKNFNGLMIEGEEGIHPEVQNSNLKVQSRDMLINRINQFQPQILFVALGQPKQEIWIADNLSKLPSVKIAMGVGGAFDFLAGTVKRAPRLMRTLGLEWLWRLMVQPWRLPRIYNATVRFTYLVTREYLNARK